MRDRTRELDPVIVLFMFLSPAIALGGAAHALWTGAAETWHVAMFVAGFFLTGLSITGGYHRLFSHVSYDAHPAIKVFYLVFGACALQNSALEWSSDHRTHHRYTDTERDPYNIKQGFWYSHMGWILYKKDADPARFANVPDLLKDQFVMWQHRGYLPIALLVGFGVPTLAGWALGSAWAGFLWGGLLRVVVVHHFTFMINSVAHTFGTQPYSNKDLSKDSGWLALLTNGEGYHNFHHKFPSDYRNGIRWFHYDPTKWLIAGLHRLGIASNLRRATPEAIHMARMEMDAWRLEHAVKTVSPERWAALRAHLEAYRGRLEPLMAQLSEARRTYRERCELARVHSDQTLQQLKQQLRDYERRFHLARAEWRMMVRRLQRRPLAAPLPGPEFSSNN